MSLNAMQWVWDHSASRGAERLVMLAIADAANAAGEHAEPSNAELVAKTLLSDRGIQKAVIRLEAMGELAVERNAGEGGRNRYRIVMTPRTQFTTTPEQSSPPNQVRGERGSTPPNQVHPEPGSPLFAAQQVNGADPEPSSPPNDVPPEQSAGGVCKEEVLSTYSRALAAAPGADPAFDEFWAVYPRRVAKTAARKAWDKLIKRGVDPEVILAGARRYRDDPRRCAADVQYTAHPATWLNGGRYEDEAEPTLFTARPGLPPQVSPHDEWRFA